MKSVQSQTHFELLRYWAWSNLKILTYNLFILNRERPHVRQSAILYSTLRDQAVEYCTAYPGLK